MTVHGNHRKLKIVISVIIPAVIVLYIILVNVLVSAALVPSFMRKLDAFDDITEKSYDEQVQTDDIKENREKELSDTEVWLKETGTQKWTETSDDGYRLVAAVFFQPDVSGSKSGPAVSEAKEYANDENHKWAVILHGYTGWKEEMYPFARQYYIRGYNVLVPDLRCQGESEGDFIGMGWTDRYDVLEWIGRIIELDSDAEVVIHGQSMGAACALMVSGMEELPDNVKAVVSDCAYTDAYSMFEQDAWDWFHLPAFPIVDSANLALQVRGGYDLKKASALEAVKKSRTPTLFIHGEEDAMVPVRMAHELYDAAGCKKQLMLVEGAGHGQSQDKQPELYWDTVFAFLRREIK